MVETRTLKNMTTCSQCITLTLKVPKDCRLNADLLSSRVAELFNKELLRDLCHDCPLERSEDED